jgi:ABC-2 type transport system permease protein
MQHVRNILFLGIKELRSLRRDPVLIGLVVYAFSLGIYSRATGISSELRNASVAVVDEDGSMLSKRILNAFFPPAFKPAEEISFSEIDPAMDSGRYTFVLDLPPDFERDLRRGRRPDVQVNIDATAMMQAGIGASHIQNIITREVADFFAQNRQQSLHPVNIDVRMKFNPNLTGAWFTSAMELIDSVTMLAIILAGGALIREREHGTIEHLLVMPLRPAEIMLAKVWANGSVILVASTLALWIVVQGILRVAITGSIPLFVAGTILYLAAGTSLGIFLATLARSMPQFGLLFIMVALPMTLLSGGNTPVDSMPYALQIIMQCFPSTHYVNIAQAVLYRGAGIDVVWRGLVAITAIAVVYFFAAALRFRKTLTAANS